MHTKTKNEKNVLVNHNPSHLHEKNPEATLNLIKSNLIPHRLVASREKNIQNTLNTHPFSIMRVILFLKTSFSSKNYERTLSYDVSLYV